MRGSQHTFDCHSFIEGQTVRHRELQRLNPEAMTDQSPGEVLRCDQTSRETSEVLFISNDERRGIVDNGTFVLSRKAVEDDISELCFCVIVFDPGHVRYFVEMNLSIEDTRMIDLEG